jgi:hypothetical protein
MKELRDSVTRFCFWFFHESVSSQAQSIPLGPFQIFSKIRKVHHRYQRHRQQILPPVSTTPTANFATSFASVVDTGVKFATGGKFSTGVNDTSLQFASGINDTGGKFATSVNDTGSK